MRPPLGRFWFDHNATDTPLATWLHFNDPDTPDVTEVLVSNTARPAVYVKPTLMSHGLGDRFKILGMLTHKLEWAYFQIVNTPPVDHGIFISFPVAYIGGGLPMLTANQVVMRFDGKGEV
jgi:hypothetical protein